MGRDEQTEEREVLDSIFADEITDITDTLYRIAIPLEVVQHDDETEAAPILLLTIAYPETYPDIPPDLALSAPPDAPKHTYLDIQNDKARLLSALQPVIEESLGMAMVFTLVNTLKDSAELLISERQAAAQALKDIEAAKAEEEENRKFHGTAVTRETFLAWRERFRKEMAEAEEKRKEDKEAEDKKRRVKAEERLTGKQLFERGLVGKVEEDEDEVDDGDHDLIQPIQELKVED
ncbi:hypothetical protein MMC17_006233 [Xylographa soralifera]|nr:hypothetical protein [Xylographa soralifera]